MRNRLIITILILLAVSCQKEPIRSNQDIWLPQEVRDMFLFYPGSYWIMELPGSGYVDSVYVLETIVDTIPIIHPGTREIMGYKDRIKVKYTSSFYAWVYDFETDTRSFCGALGIDEACIYVRKQNYNEGTPTTRSYIYYYPEIVGSSFPTANDGRTQDKVSLTQLHSSFTLFDSTYLNTREVEVNIDKTEQYQRSVRRFTPHVGMISWQIPSFGFNWVTVRHKVVQTP